MKRIFHGLLLAAVAALALVLAVSEGPSSAAAHAATVSGIKFNQVDFYLNGSLQEGNSEWGEFTVEYVPGDQLEFINVVASASGPDPDQWVVRNLPLISSALEPGTLNPGTLNFTADFDLGPLGVTSGTQLPDIDYCFTQSTQPSTSTSPPGCVPNPTVLVQDSQEITNTGVPSGVVAAGAPPPAGVVDFLDPFVGVEAHWHKDMPNVVQARNQCGPGAAANSLHWLAKEQGWPLKDADIQMTLAQLANDMDNRADGAWDGPWTLDGDRAGFASGKLKFIKTRDFLS